VSSRNERGVLAQELQQVMPNAVHPIGDVVVDSKKITNFLTVNERLLLYENIGATQHLDKELEIEKHYLIEVDSKVDEFAATSSLEQSSMKQKIQSMYGLLFEEEDRHGVVYSTSDEEYVNIPISLFRMGPCRTFFVLGHFFPWFWCIGCLYIFSNIRRRKILGWICLCLFLLYAVLLVCTFFRIPRGEKAMFNMRLVEIVEGVFMLMGNYRRLRQKIAAKALAKAQETKIT